LQQWKGEPHASSQRE